MIFGLLNSAYFSALWSPVLSIFLQILDLWFLGHSSNSYIILFSLPSIASSGSGKIYSEEHELCSQLYIDLAPCNTRCQHCNLEQIIWPFCSSFSFYSKCEIMLRCWDTVGIELANYVKCLSYFLWDFNF
jgi:hypothetical protein